MKVYLATSGWPGEYDYKVVGVFARREDAEAYELGDRVEEFELLEALPEVRDWHVVRRTYGHDHHSYETSERVIFDGNPDRVESRIDMGFCAPHEVVAEGWNVELVREEFARKCAEFLAERQAWAASVVSKLDRVDVRVWYEVCGQAVLMTPVHRTAERFEVPRDRITDQAGLERGAYLHGQWFTVTTCTYTEVDGFSVCRDPNMAALAEG